MGIVNVTPDSFSDGGRWLDPELAIAHGLELAADGADILDVGGESTRPGAAPVEEGEELRRIIPVVSALAARSGVAVSVDTTKAAVAIAAIDAGATIVNDVSAGRLDPRMLDTVAARSVDYIAMHMQGEPRTMQTAPHYHDVVAEVAEFLLDRLVAAEAAGIARERIMVDPGIGFGKTAEHNLTLLCELPTLVDALSDIPVLIGASRKSFLGSLVGGADAAARDDATLATTVWCFERGATAVRVHDVRSAARAARLLETVAAVTPEDVFA
jgi:dihydropteroate synthase